MIIGGVKPGMLPFTLPSGLAVQISISRYPLVNVYIAMENHHVQWENRL